MSLTPRQTTVLLKLHRAGGSLTFARLHEGIGCPRNTVVALAGRGLVAIPWRAGRGKRKDRWVDLTPRGRVEANAAYRRWKKAVGL